MESDVRDSRGRGRDLRGVDVIAPGAPGHHPGSDVNDPLLELRAEFPILERTTYLVSNSLGAMPRAVPNRLAEYASQWAALGVRAWAKGWWEMPVSVGDEI